MANKNKKELTSTILRLDFLLNVFEPEDDCLNCMLTKTIDRAGKLINLKPS